MLCSDVMKTAIRSVSPDATVQEAAQLMRDEGVGFLPVCDSQRRVVGTITDRDIAVRVVANGEDPEESLAQFMSEDVVACGPADDLDHVEELMSEEKVGRIMCIDEDGVLQGVISLSDLAELDRGLRTATTLREVSDREVR